MTSGPERSRRLISSYSRWNRLSPEFRTMVLSSCILAIYTASLGVLYLSEVSPILDSAQELRIGTSFRTGWPLTGLLGVGWALIGFGSGVIYERYKRSWGELPPLLGGILVLVSQITTTLGVVTITAFSVVVGRSIAATGPLGVFSVFWYIFIFIVYFPSVAVATVILSGILGVGFGTGAVAGRGLQ